MSPRERFLANLLLPIAAAAIVFLPSMAFDLVFDDRAMIVDNPAIRDVVPSRYFLDPKSGAAPDSGLWQNNYRPLFTLSLALDYRFAGLEARWYHLHSLLWHLLNCALVWLVCRSLTGSRFAWLGTLIFAIHPVQTQSVAWVAQRSGLMSAAGVLAALLLLGTHPLGWARRLCGWVALVFALFSKEAAIVFPALLLLYRWLGTRRGTVRRVMDGPSFAGSVVLVMLFMLIRHQVLGRWAQVPAEASVVGEHTAEAMLAAVQYLGKLLLPVGLRPTYQYPDLTVLRVLLAASTLVWLGVLIVRSRRRYPMFFFTGLWILIALSPVLHFVPLEPFPFFADRFMYVPLVGVAVLATWAAERWRASRPLLYLWGGALVFMTTSALDPWESDAALWAHAVRQDPSNAFAWVNYADTLQDPRLRETAYRRALQTRPNADMAFAIMNNLAHVSNAQRNGWQGRYWAQKALRLAPDSKTARYNLARAALLEKDWIAAEREIKRLQSLAGPRDPSVKALKTALSNRR